VSEPQNRVPSGRLRSLLVVLAIFGGAALAASLAVHNARGAWLAGSYLVFVAIAGPVSIWRGRH
jgi:hypothetical protein